MKCQRDQTLIMVIESRNTACFLNIAKCPTYSNFDLEVKDEPLDGGSLCVGDFGLATFANAFTPKGPDFPIRTALTAGPRPADSLYQPPPGSSA